jgi:SAM-dependent methyltransferase
MKLASSRTDRDWEKWGKQNPYFGVISWPKFLNANLDEESLQEFFATGERHVEHVYSVIRAKIRQDFQPIRVLDYGCGVGRLVIPFAKRAGEVIGVDVSFDMLECARENCNKFGAGSAHLLHTDEVELLKPATFDLVHSFIVFQHIPTDRGDLILRKLITLLAEGGVGAIHLTYSNPRSESRSPIRRGIKALLKRVGFQRLGLVHGLLNLREHRRFSAPRMEVNSYSMNRIFNILFDAHCSDLHIEFSDHGGIRGAMLYFVKSSKPIFLC